MSSDNDIEIEDQDYEPDKKSKQKPTKQRRQSGPSQQPKTQAAGPSTQGAGSAPGAHKRRRNCAAGPSSASKAPGLHEAFVYPREEQAKVQNKIAKYAEESAKRADEVNLGLSHEDLERLAGKVVRHMLFSQFDKPGVPVTRAKLSEVITADYKTHKSVRKMPAVIIAMAQERCLKALGMEMKEVERPSASTKKGEDAGGAKTYVLRSMLPAAVRQAVLQDAHRRRGAPPGLTMVVLALVHMEGGKMREEALWEWLHELGVGEGQDHPSLGKIKDAMGRMEACRYVVKSKGGHDQGHVYEWGECAHDEVGAAGIKAFIDNEFKHQYSRPAEVQGEGEEPETVVLDDD